jgi:peroxiredoxin Q/BCP
VRHEVERVIVVGEGGGICDAERDPAVGVEPYLRLRAADHLLREIDAPDAGGGELARHQKRSLARSGSDVERPLGLRLDLKKGGGERSEVLGRGSVSIRPPRRLAIEEAAHRDAKQGPEPRSADDKVVHRPPKNSRPAPGKPRTGSLVTHLGDDGNSVASCAVATPDVGDRAPDFELPGTGGRTYRLADYGEHGVILAFYPGDFTPVCTKQFCSYRDDGDRLEALGVPMLGISPQSVASHERFAAENGLNVPLAADVDKTVARAYGVLAPGGYVRRSIFLVDEAGVICHRHVAMFGVRYQDMDALEGAVKALA